MFYVLYILFVRIYYKYLCISFEMEKERASVCGVCVYVRLMQFD